MDGRFNIPFMRGDFDLVPNVNHVTFIATKSIADGETPDLHLEATNLVTDANGNDHNVTHGHQRPDARGAHRPDPATTAWIATRPRCC